MRRGMVAGVVLLVGLTGCGAIRDYAKEQGELAGKEVLAGWMDREAPKYLTVEQFSAWKLAADTDKSGDVSPDEWWEWVKENWEIGAMLLGFGYLQQRVKRKTTQVWEKIGEIETRAPVVAMGHMPPSGPGV